MNESGHFRCIIHIRTDCCNLETDDSILRKPLAIHSNDKIYSLNHKAQSCGVERNMNVSEACLLCPNLVLINNDPNLLQDYRQLSYAVTSHLQKYSMLVERLGLDENYMDITSLVLQADFVDNCKCVGDIYGSPSNVCKCGCYKRLVWASNVADKIRQSLNEEFGLRCSMTLSHNKLIAKAVNDLQTCSSKLVVVFPPNGTDLILEKSIDEIPGIAKTVAKSLLEIEVKHVKDLQSVDLKVLQERFSKETVKYLQELSFGNDSAPVRSRCLNLDDVSRPATVEGSVNRALDGILKRLLALLTKEQRTPRRMELLVRKYDKFSGHSRKEAKYVNLHPKLFAKTQSETIKQLLSMAMKLFLKAVDVNKPFHVTLLGLSFQRFAQNDRLGCLPLQRPSLEVQAVTNIEYEPDPCDIRNQMDCSSLYYSDNTDGSETELEPSPKKRRCSPLPFRSFRFGEQCPSPSKLRVAELRINSET